MLYLKYPRQSPINFSGVTVYKDSNIALAFEIKECVAEYI